MVKEKNGNTQIIRGILISMVVCIHSISMCSFYENFLLIGIRTICNIAVPSFLFISGFYFNTKKYNENKKYIYYRIKKLAIPLIIWNFIYFFISSNFNIKSLIGFANGGHLYFILVLIQLILITPLILKYYNYCSFRYILYSISIAYLIVYRILWIKFDFIIPLHEYYFVGWIIYYLEGIKYRELLDNGKDLNEKNIVIKSIFLYLVVYVYNLVIYVNNGFEYALSQMNILNLIFSIQCFKLIFKFIKSKKMENNVLKNIGDESFGIYFIHILILRIVSLVLKSNEIYIILIRAVITIFTSYIVIKYFKRITKNKFDNILGF